MEAWLPAAALAVVHLALRVDAAHRVDGQHEHIGHLGDVERAVQLAAGGAQREALLVRRQLAPDARREGEGLKGARRLRQDAAALAQPSTSRW